jgi:hypothetical protein
MDVPFSISHGGGIKPPPPETIHPSVVYYKWAGKTRPNNKDEPDKQYIWLIPFSFSGNSSK